MHVTENIYFLKCDPDFEIIGEQAETNPIVLIDSDGKCSSDNGVCVCVGEQDIDRMGTNL